MTGEEKETTTTNNSEANQNRKIHPCKGRWGERSGPTTFRGTFSLLLCGLIISRDFTTYKWRREAGWCCWAGLWQEVTPAQQRLCLKIPGQDLAVSINRWTPWAWWRGRGSGRKLYLTMITIWHLPELHILDESSRLSRSLACANEAAVNRIVLAPTVAILTGTHKTSLLPALHQCQLQRGGRWGVKAAGGVEETGWGSRGLHGHPQCKLWAQADEKCMPVHITFRKSYLTLDLTFQVCKMWGIWFQKKCVQFWETHFDGDNNQKVGSRGKGTRNVNALWGTTQQYLRDSYVKERYDLLHTVPEGRKRVRRWRKNVCHNYPVGNVLIVRMVQIEWALQEQGVPQHVAIATETGRLSPSGEWTRWHWLLKCLLNSDYRNLFFLLHEICLQDGWGNVEKQHYWERAHWWEVIEYYF